MHTREIAAYGGLVNRMPLYAVAFMVFTMANVGLPGTSGFVGEFLTPDRRLPANTWVAFFATTGVILSAAYALWLYRRVIFGALEKPSLQGHPRSRRRARSRILAPLVAARRSITACSPAPILDAFARLDRGARSQDYPGRAVARPRPPRCRAALRYRPMNPTSPPPAFGPALPEIVLAVGALVLVLVGAYPAASARRGSSTVGALALLVVALRRWS